MKSAPNRYKWADRPSLHRDRETRRGTRGLGSDFTPRRIGRVRRRVIRWRTGISQSGCLAAGRGRPALHFYTGKNRAGSAMSHPMDDTHLAVRMFSGRARTPGSPPTNCQFLGKKSLILADLVLQGGRQFVHVRGRKVHHGRVKDRDAVTSDRIPPHLDQQSLQRLGIVFLRCHAD